MTTIQYDEVNDRTERIVLRAIFRDEDGNRQNPMLPVSVQVKPPNGDWVEETDEATQIRTGVFEHEYVGEGTDQGTYAYKFVSADGGIEDGEFEVERVD